MRALPEAERTNNTDKDLRARKPCRPCGDSGWVADNVRADTYNGRTAVIEEMAPCPFCLRGYRFEFPDPAWLAKDEAIDPPWGQDGYWRGRDLPDHLLEAQIAAYRTPPPMNQAQQLAAIQTLAATIGRPMPAPEEDVRPVEALRAELPDEAYFEPPGPEAVAARNGERTT